MPSLSDIFIVEFGEEYLTYTEAAEALAAYLSEMNYTHVELMPVTEFPFKGSWGYQVTGYFAATSRFGTPQEFMALVDTLHYHGIGVILDGIPLNDPSGFAPDLYDVDWATVQNIEVLRGPAAGLYGSSGSAGIIDITTIIPFYTIWARFKWI